MADDTDIEDDGTEVKTKRRRGPTRDELKAVAVAKWENVAATHAYAHIKGNPVMRCPHCGQGNITYDIHKMSARIRFAREVINMPIEELSLLTDIPVSHLRSYEDDEHPTQPRVQSLSVIAKWLKTPPGFLSGGA